MFFDPLDIPDKLLEAQEQGKLVVFAGAGVSMGEPSNLPSFKGLAQHAATGHPLAAEIAGYESRLDEFFGELARRQVDVQRLCRDRISDISCKPTDLHGWLTDLFIKTEETRIVTTNFDNHFRAVLEGRGVKTDLFHAPALPLGNRFTGLVSIHGSISRPEPLVLTDEEFGRAYLTEGWAREFLQRLFAEFTTLFVGYSHNDVPIKYLARGMSRASMAPRFAFAPDDEPNHWPSLGITQIVYHKAATGNPFEPLYSGLKTWAQFTKQQPTEIAQRIKDMVCTPETMAPDRAQRALLIRCLEREGPCQFFTQDAKGWKWVEWLEKEGLLSSLFEPTRGPLTEAQTVLAGWLAQELLAEKSEAGLLLVEKYKGRPGRHLWSALHAGLWLSDNLDWISTLTHKWVLLVIETCPDDNIGMLSRLLEKAAKAAPDPLGLVLLRRLLRPRAVVTKGVDFSSVISTGDAAQVKEQPEFEITLQAETHTLDRAWESSFKPRLRQLNERLLDLFQEILRTASELYRVSEPTLVTSDPWCHRSRIYDRDAYRTGRGVELVLDFLLDVIEESAGAGCSSLKYRIIAWLDSGVPALVRLGLYAADLDQNLSPNEKIKLIENRHLVYPKVFGASHEVWRLVSNCYPHLNAEGKNVLWVTISAGPRCERPDGVEQSDWDESRHREIDKLTWFLASKHSTCPMASEAMKMLKGRNPDFQGYEGMDQDFSGGSQILEGPCSPKSSAELISRSPKAQIDFLLSFKGSTDPFKESRQGLLAAVGSACAENPDWGIAFLEQLEARGAWGSDLWEAAFRWMNLSTLAPEKLGWLLGSLERHFAEFASLQGLTHFFFHGVDFAPGKAPTKGNLELMIRLSLLIWNQIRSTQAAITEDFHVKGWTDIAINHPAGRIAEFWLKCCDVHRREEGEAAGFPPWINGPLQDAIRGTDFASQLARSILALHLPLVYFLDPSWTSSHLFPKFRFSVVGDEAFIAWEPHLKTGKLSRDLILRIPPLYHEAFARFRDVEGDSLIGFFRHIAVIIYSGLVDVYRDGWFQDFLVGLPEDQRAMWANQMELVLRSAPPERKIQIWRGWMRDYWQRRVMGKPCPLSKKESEEMFDWALVMAPAFDQAVELLTQGPRPDSKIGTAIYVLENERPEIVQQHPDAVLQLLEWLLQGVRDQWTPLREIELFLFRFPRKKPLLPRLFRICERLSALGYVGALDLKLTLEREFTSE